MAPADIKKEGSGYDLPLAIGILAAEGKVKSDHLNDFMIIGELGLDGNLQPVRGALPIAIKARTDKFKGLIVPKQNIREAAVVNNIDVYGMENIVEVISFINGTSAFEPTIIDTRKEFYEQQSSFELDFSDVRGQDNVKRALEVAAAGGHNVIMIGAPGSGKSMMAKRLPSILPPLSLSESLETTQIHSVAGKLGKNMSLISQRPFRSPHHTISQVALVGGGTNPQPGEISLAHNGVLFADELPEFNRSVLEVLRQPLEDRKITISRAKYTTEYPCSFMFVTPYTELVCADWLKYNMRRWHSFRNRNSCPYPRQKNRRISVPMYHGQWQVTDAANVPSPCLQNVPSAYCPIWSHKDYTGNRDDTHRPYKTCRWHHSSNHIPACDDTLDDNNLYSSHSTHLRVSSSSGQNRPSSRPASSPRQFYLHQVQTVPDNPSTFWQGARPSIHQQ